MVLAYEGVHPAGVDLRHIPHGQSCSLDNKVVGREFEGPLVGGVYGVADSQGPGHVHVHRQVIVRDGLLRLLQPLGYGLVGEMRCYSRVMGNH